jgi:hypothetical protein
MCVASRGRRGTWIPQITPILDQVVLWTRSVMSLTMYDVFRGSENFATLLLTYTSMSIVIWCKAQLRKSKQPNMAWICITVFGRMHVTVHTSSFFFEGRGSFFPRKRAWEEYWGVDRDQLLRWPPPDTPGSGDARLHKSHPGWPLYFLLGNQLLKIMISRHKDDQKPWHISHLPVD